MGVTTAILGLQVHAGFYNSDGSIDFAHTMRLTGISGSDEQGAPLQGFWLTYSDGFGYAAAVPEPATAAVLQAGLLGLGARWRLRCRLV